MKCEVLSLPLLEWIHNLLFLWKVRAASVTCFAGITSSVFSSLSKEKEDYILSSVVSFHLDETEVYSWILFWWIKSFFNSYVLYFKGECCSVWWGAFSEVSCLSCHWRHIMFPSSFPKVLLKLWCAKRLCFLHYLHL